MNTRDVYEVGDLVLVYRDPMEKERPERIARLIERVRSEAHGESWMVKFPHKETPAERFLAYPK